MHSKTLGLVAAQLFVMYSMDPAIQQAVDAAAEPYNTLIELGFKLGVHDIPANDGERNTDLAYLIEPLMIEGATCNGQ